MRAGCCAIERSEDGLVRRYRVRSQVFKGAPAGLEDASWVTIAPVSEAVTLMERSPNTSGDETAKTASGARYMRRPTHLRTSRIESPSC